MRCLINGCCSLLTDFGELFGCSGLDGVFLTLKSRTSLLAAEDEARDRTLEAWAAASGVERLDGRELPVGEAVLAESPRFGEGVDRPLAAKQSPIKGNG